MIKLPFFLLLALNFHVESRDSFLHLIVHLLFVLDHLFQTGKYFYQASALLQPLQKLLIFRNASVHILYLQELFRMSERPGNRPF